LRYAVFYSCSALLSILRIALAFYRSSVGDGSASVAAWPHAIPMEANTTMRARQNIGQSIRGEDGWIGGVPSQIGNNKSKGEITA
jgi:hypothetical protein